MPGRGIKVPSPSEFLSYSKEEKIKIFNRLAERYNKQLPRARAAKILPRGLYEKKETTYVTRISKKTSLSEERILQKFNELTKRPQLTKTAVKKRKKLAEELKKMTGGTVTAKQLSGFQKAMKRANTERALFYQLMIRAENADIIDDYKLPDNMRATMSTEAATDWFLARLEEKAEQNNKQRRTPEEAEKAKADIEAAAKIDAARWEATTGAERFGDAPVKLNAKQMAEIVKLFPQ